MYTQIYIYVYVYIFGNRKLILIGNKSNCIMTKPKIKKKRENIKRRTDRIPELLYNTLVSDLFHCETCRETKKKGKISV